jgi:thiamine biosynthesis lipoprotein ApbE
MNRTTTRAIAAGAVGLLALALSGCGQQMRAERDGRDLAESICDLQSASDAEAAQSAIDDIVEEIDDLATRYGVATAEDRADIQNNLADLAEHAVQGNEVLVQQDIAVLQRSAENIREDVGGVQESAWTGLSAGLEECLTN